MEFTKTDFGGEWVDEETGETTCEVTLEKTGDMFSVDVWRPDTGTVTYRDVMVLPARGIPEFGVENDLAVGIEKPGYELPVAVPFGVAKSLGTREPSDHGEKFLRTLVEALEEGYGKAVEDAAKRIVA